MKLYKYIPFKSNHWSEPANTGLLYFSNIGSLRTVNDESEFRHEWENSSAFMAKYGQSLKVAYNSVFSNARVLCLSTLNSAQCWQTFCLNGGVCYEYSFDQTKCEREITKGRIVYADNKEHNVPKYFISQINDPIIRNLISSEKIDSNELQNISNWIQSGTTQRDILVNHITHELTFKKLTPYKCESEYRFVHIQKSVGGIQLKAKLVDSKLPVSTLGLNLLKIYATDVDRAKDGIPTHLHEKIKRKNFA